MQYILNETEYQAFLALKEENAELSHKLDTYRKTYDSMNKTSCINEQKILVLETELANLSSKLREAKRDCEGTSKVLEETQKISAARLATMNHLQAEVRRLKSEHVCIATHPQTGTVKVVSVEKADTYRKFGWIVSGEYLVDRPA